MANEWYRQIHYQPPTNPPEMPDDPELEDILIEYLRSECCGQYVTEERNNSYKCSCCSLFCKINVDKSIEAWSKSNG